MSTFLSGPCPTLDRKSNIWISIYYTIENYDTTFSSLCLAFFTARIRPNYSNLGRKEAIPPHELYELKPFSASVRRSAQVRPSHNQHSQTGRTSEALSIAN